MAEQECVGFIDMDCFYVAVERTLDKSLVGVPCAVCQYESQQKDTKTVDRTENRKVTVGGASLIAVSYEARAAGVTRMMNTCLLYTSPSPRDRQKSRMPSSA